MDSAYDAPQIRSYSAELGHVPIIDTNPRRGDEERDGSCASGAFQESQHSRASQLEFEGQLWWPVRAGSRGCQGDDAFDVRADSDNGNAALPTPGMRER